MADSDRVARLRATVRAQAEAAGAAGWMEIPVPAAIAPSGRLRVPRGAFERWAVRPTGATHLAAPWEPVSPRGLKQGGDDPYHTDWMLGAGLAPGDMAHGAPDRARVEALTDAAYGARAEVERRLLGFACSVLVAGPGVEGRAWHPAGPDDTPPWHDDPPIAILRDGRPEWLGAAMAALSRGGAVVVERGGEMAHLVTELRGEGLGPVLRVPDARRLYPEGLRLGLTPWEGRVAIRDDGRPPPEGPAEPEPSTTRPARAVRRPPPGPPPRLVAYPWGKANPADAKRCFHLDRSLRRQAGPFRIQGVVLGDGPDDAVCELVVRVAGGGLASMNYCAGARDWTDEEGSAAMTAALDLHAPPRPGPDGEPEPDEREDEDVAAGPGP